MREDCAAIRRPHYVPNGVYGWPVDGIAEDREDDIWTACKDQWEKLRMMSVTDANGNELAQTYEREVEEKE